MTPREQVAVWWLEAELSCGFCLQGYARRTELYCTGCDREGCALCVRIDRETHEVWCPECDPRPEDER